MRLIDLTGNRFGNLVVVKRANGSGQAKWECICDCGNKTVVRASHLKDGGTTSCGCARLKRAIDITGQVFGRLTVIERANNKGSGDKARAMWRCACQCGGATVAAAYSLKSGNTQSCGCLKIESSVARGKARKRHGLKNTKVWICWMSMNQRCHNKNRRDYRLYGGRGIKVCDRWAVFENFFSDMGHPPDGMTIDRIDVNGNYEPNNCRWATPTEQGRNRRNNRLITIDGETATLSEWSEAYGINEITISDRIKRGWDVSVAIKTPAAMNGIKAKPRSSLPLG